MPQNHQPSERISPESLNGYRPEYVVNKCKRFMLTIRHNPESDRPLMVDELSAINDFVSGLPEESDIQWSVMQDSSLGNKVEVVLLCNINH